MSSPQPRQRDDDPFLFDAEQLHELSDESTISAGVRLFRDHCVIGLDRTDDGLWARVEDADWEDHLEPVLYYDSDGNLGCTCQCDEERLAGSSRLCAHGVAALYAFAAREEGAGNLTDALEAAIEERVTRARNEVRVEPVSGEPWFGTWRARSVAPGPYPRAYEVSIRSLTRRANHCTCPDFATNQLGTCKHIEAVLHRIQRRKDFKRIQGKAPPHGYCFLDWDCDRPPRVRLHRASETEVGLNALLAPLFDGQGLFRGRLPEDLLALADQVAERADFEVGRDALDHARRLADEAARAQRAATIAEEIQATGGRIPGLDAKLYPYQVEGVAFLAGRGRALLADDMGLGKTLQAIAAAHWLHRRGEVERILVVCPASLKLQWAREIQRFTGHEAQVIGGSAQARQVQYRKGAGFHVANYELVMRDLSEINQNLAPDLLILDEAQRIKNWRTKVAAAVKRIPSRHAFVLSGTPLENRLEDLYSLMQVVDPHVLGPLWRYLADFHVTDERGKVLGYRGLSELRRRLQAVMLRRDRALVRDQLPERITSRLDCTMTARQQELHDDGVETAAKIALIMQRRPLTPSEQNRMLAAMQRARMACNAAGLVDKETQGSPKLDELEDLLHDLCRMGSQKAVIFSQWAQMTEMVEQVCRRMELGSVRLHGGVPTANRGALMDRFRDDDAVQVFISTDAGGVGLNLQHASVLINLDIPWNPAVLDQRIARVHRLGQRERVQVLMLIAPDSYEERVLQLVQGKRHLFDNVVDPDASEDVVGISKRLAEVLAEDLAGGAAGGETHEDAPAVAPAEEAETPPALPETSGALSPPPAPEVSAPETSTEVQTCLQRLQSRFGPRIRRVLGARGSLCVVLDHVDDADDAFASELSDQVPVALIDPRTLRGLARLGDASPLAQAQTLAAPSESAAEPTEPPLLRQAARRLEAARSLLAAGQNAVAAEQLRDALLAAAAHRAGRDQPPAHDQAGIWLYRDALPSGVLDAADAATLMGAIALAQGGDAIPAGLVGGLAADTEAFIARQPGA